MAEEKYIIGDTIRLEATIKNYAGVETAPASITVSVYQLDGTSLLSSGTPNLVDGTTAQYYYNWTIETSSGVGNIDQRLAVVWNWSGPHTKKKLFNIIPIL